MMKLLIKTLMLSWQARQTPNESGGSTAVPVRLVHWQGKHTAACKSYVQHQHQGDIKLRGGAIATALVHYSTFLYTFASLEARGKSTNRLGAVHFNS